MKFFIIFLFLGFGINVSYAQSIPANASPALFGGEWQCDRGYKKDNSQTKCVLVQIPENGELDYTGHNWVCKRGYKKDSTYAKCIEVEIPENAELDYTGHSWTCKRGFKKDTTYKKCDVVSIPANAELDYTGQNWTCKRGYKKDSNHFNCEAVIVPANAELDYTGHNWTCQKGYRKDGSGSKCILIDIPENAQLDYSGHNWTCNEGFRKSSDVCVAMTVEELKKQQELKAALIAEMQRRKAAGVSGDDCETEYKTGAEICVSVSGVNIDCTESYGDDYYSGCEVHLEYDIETDYSGGSYLDTEVSCEVEIEYEKADYGSGWDSANDSDSHDLYSHGNSSESMYFSFSFSSYEKVYKAQVTSADCEIDSVDLW